MLYFVKPFGGKGGKITYKKDICLGERQAKKHIYFYARFSFHKLLKNSANIRLAKSDKCNKTEICRFIHFWTRGNFLILYFSRILVTKD